MADLVLDWGALGPYGTNLSDEDGGVSATVDTGGVAVDISFDALQAAAQAFTFNAPGFVGAGETFSPTSFLKLFGEGNGGATSDTSTATLDFRATNTDLYTDSVQNVSFRLNDIDMGAAGDLFEAGSGFEDIVNVTAFDAAGNPVPVTLSLGSAVTNTGGDLTGTSETGFEDGAASVLVEIAGPVSSITVSYANGGPSQQGVTISDVEFSTVDVEGGAPDAVDDTITTGIDTPVTIDPTTNDTDPDNDPLTVTGITPASNGTATLNGDGTVTYTPATGFTGTDTITYTITDGNGGTDTATITFTVEDDPNVPPTAFDDSATTDEDVTVTITPLANDDDPDGDNALLTVASITQPTNGSAVLNADGTVDYTPAAGFTGTDTFTYQLEDPDGGSDTGTITVTVSEADGTPRIDTDVFPVAPGDQPLDPLDGLDEDPDPLDDLDSIVGDGTDELIETGDDADTIAAGGGNDTVNPGIDNDHVTLGAGDDSVFDVQGADTIFGGSGNDTIIAGTDTFSDYEGDDPSFAPGTPLNDLGFLSDPNTEDGRDYVEGNLGNDSIATGDDADTIDGGGDNDTLDGGIDDDLIMGGQGDDSLIGSHGSDTLDGGQGNDTLDGSNLAALELTDDIDPNTENDRDLLQGFLGNDSLIGGDDDDTLMGGSGEDTLDGGIDDDLLMGGDDADLMFGGQGDDTLFGGDGNDTIEGGSGLNLSIGGAGQDSIIGGADGDTIQGGTGDDTLIGSEGADSIVAGAGSDAVTGGTPGVTGIDAIGATPDTLIGGTGDDTLDGSSGDDFLFGENGNDVIYGGTGADSLVGGAGNDLLVGHQEYNILTGEVTTPTDAAFALEPSNDKIDGNDGDDTLIGGTGQDSIHGGADRDVIIVESAEHGIGDTVDGGSGGFVDQVNPEDPPNQDYDILDLSGVGAQNIDWRIVNEVVDSNGNGIDGTIEFLDGSGAVTGTLDFFEIEEIVPCFTPGTLIATPQGERLVEDLQVGDRVITRDNGIQEIKWVGRKDLSGFDLARKPHFKPILIQQGALGNNLPEHDMLVSPNHRVLVANDKTALYFEEREVLVAAKHLTGLEGVDEVEANGVAYIHVMFESHEVILSNGAWTESFQPGDYSLKGIGNAQRQEILELFPELEHAEGLKAYASARRSLKKHEAALLTD